MIIKSIELNNFRIYKGCHKIDLSVTDKENIGAVKLLEKCGFKEKWVNDKRVFIKILKD